MGTVSAVSALIDVAVEAGVVPDSVAYDPMVAAAAALVVDAASVAVYRSWAALSGETGKAAVSEFLKQRRQIRDLDLRQ